MENLYVEDLAYDILLTNCIPNYFVAVEIGEGSCWKFSVDTTGW